MEKNKIDKYFKSLLAKDYRILGLFIFLCLILKILYIFGSVIWRVDLFFYIQGAKTMLDGGILYRDFMEVKPPGIFFLYYSLMRAFGYENILFLIKLLAIASQTLSAFFFFKVLESMFDRERGIYGGIIFILASSINFEFWPCNVMLLYLLPISVSIFFMVRNKFDPGNFNLLLSGFFLSLAFLISTNIIFYALIFPVFIFFCTKNIRTAIYKNIYALAGFLIPLGFMFFYFYYNNALEEWCWSNFKWAGIYGASGPLWRKILQFFTGMILNWVWIPLYIYSIFGIQKIFKDKAFLRDKTIFFILLIALFSILSRLMLTKFVARYYLYLLPGLIFCVVLALDRPVKKHFKAIMLSIIVSGFLFNYIFSLHASYNPVVESRRDIYSWVRQNTAPADRIFVWHEGYEFYFFCRRPMATSFFSTSQHLDYPKMWEQNNYRDIDVPWKKFMIEFERDNPALVIDVTGNFTESNEKYRRAALKSYMDGFKNLIKKNYTPAKEFGVIKIWKRIK